MNSLIRESCTYRTVCGMPLEARVLLPAGDRTPRAAYAYFHPGGWRAGGPGFFRELQYIASRGMVAAAFGHRLLPDRKRKAVPRKGYSLRFDAARSIKDCVADAQAAIGWLRARDDVDGTRVVAAGYSSGAHLAAATAFLPPVETLNGSCRPDALVLYAGIFDLGAFPGLNVGEAGAAALSPLHNVGPKAPPGLVLYGVDDTLTRGQCRSFAQAMGDAGNRCEVAEFSGGHHTFQQRFDNPVFAPWLARVDEFLVSLGYLDAAPDVERRIAEFGRSQSKPRRTRRREESTP